MTLTLTDLFCGAGGSSTGAIQVPGISIKLAVNHWERAIETHSANHPDTEHLCADIQVTNPHYLPSTDILWASPSCTNHSKAKGKKRPTNQPDLFGETIADEAAEKSRATMWNVPEFSEAHNYNIVLIENVVEAMFWLPFRSWLQSMDDLGYYHQLIFLNSMHASWQGIGAPQSRDRMYVCFWKKGNPKPDLESMQRPEAWCAECGELVRARQWWKNPAKPYGKYRSQYLYRCPNSACRNSIVEPIAEAAASIIDWADLGERIGDRDKPLADKTMRRIKMGIEKHWAPIHLEHGGNGYDAADPKHPQYMNPDSYYRAWNVSEPFKTMHTRESKGIALHPLTMAYYGSGVNTNKVTEPMSTVTTVERHALLAPGGSIDVNDVHFRMLTAHEIKRAMAFPANYVITGNRREQVKQAGNAVTPPATRDLVAAAAQSLGVFE